MKVLALYCYGGIGREIITLIQQKGGWDKIVFIDDNIEKHTVCDMSILSLEACLQYYVNDDLFFLVTSGEPFIRKSIYERLILKELVTTSFFYQGFIEYKNTTILSGTIIHLGAVLTSNVEIGFGCLINKNAVIAHDVKIDDYCVISTNTAIGGNVYIGANTFIGSGATIRNGIKIGKNSIIGMGSVIIDDVDDRSVVVGNPGKVIRFNDDNFVFKQ